MTRTLSHLAPVAVLIGAALTLSACSLLPGGGGAEKLDPEKSPLSEYMSAFYGEQDDEFYAKQAQQVEEMVAECMKDEGFEYIPVDQTQYGSFDFDWEERQTKEWIAANGYGVNLSEEQQEEQNAQYENFTDPNDDYRSSLSESESTAYWEVLYGPQPSEDELNDDGSYEYNWENGGCYGVAQHEVSGDQPYDQDQFKPLFEAMSALYEDQSKDPRMKELDAAWASCMADAGFDGFKVQFDAANSIYEQQNEFWENNTDGSSPTAEQTAEWRDKEIDTALADYDCKEKTNYTQAALAVQFELEEQFIKDHKAELDELVAFSEKNKK
jgi:hypothetical protein